MLPTGISAAHVMFNFSISRGTTNNLKLNAMYNITRSDDDAITMWVKPILVTGYPEINKQNLQFTLLSRTMKFLVARADLMAREHVVLDRLLSSALPQFDKDRIEYFQLLKVLSSDL